MVSIFCILTVLMLIAPNAKGEHGVQTDVLADQITQIFVSGASVLARTLPTLPSIQDLVGGGGDFNQCNLYSKITSSGNELAEEYRLRVKSAMNKFKDAFANLPIKITTNTRTPAIEKLEKRREQMPKN